MRVFVTEFITGGGMANHPLPEGLKQEGLLMLKSVLADCSRINNIELVTTLDSRIKIDSDNIEISEVGDSANYFRQVHSIASQCDVCWVIAPESGGVLATMVHDLTQENATTINCDLETIRISGDKLKCAIHLINANLKTIPCLSREEVNSSDQKIVIKSRFGVGCEGLRICDSGKHALDYIEDFEQWVVQPYVEGKHLSLSLLCLQGEAKILACNIQKFIGEYEPRLQRCSVNAVPVTNQLKILANKIAQTLPGLRAYVGVDVIENENELLIVDINPRLTSSYVGLSEVLTQNPAELCIDSIMKNKLPNKIMRNEKIIEVALD